MAEGVARVPRPPRPPARASSGIQVGDDPASEIYQAGKAKAAEEAGMVSRRIVLPEETTQAELDALIDELNADDAVDGMLVQLPVPDQLSEVRDRQPHPPRQGRGRLRAGQPRAPGARRAGLGALHPRRDACGCSTGAGVPAGGRATPWWWGAA